MRLLKMRNQSFDCRKIPCVAYGVKIVRVSSLGLAFIMGEAAIGVFRWGYYALT